MEILVDKEMTVVKNKEVKTVDKEGLILLLGKRVTLFCMNYIYTGELIGVNTNDIKLEDAKIVFETGAFSEKKFKDAQSLGVKYFYIRTATIESYGELNKE